MIAPSIQIAGQERASVRLSAGELDKLSDRLTGRLIPPGDPAWKEAASVWNGAVTKTPSLIAQPASTHDVANIINFAQEHDLLLGIKGGGHNIGGAAIPEAGLLMDMSRLRAIQVDPDARLAHVGAGCRLAEVDRATQEHGLATVLGFVSETGVAGLTLGGGLGYLSRRFGWTVDNLEQVEIVTADGRRRIASRHDEPELFWGVRGAGANLGAITRFTFRLHPVGPQVYGGLVAWPFDDVQRILDAYREITEAAPRELAVWMVLLHAPPAPFIPAHWVGRKLCAMTVAHTGDPDQAPSAIRPIRSLDGSVFDLLAQRPYTELQSFLDATEPAGMHHYWKTEYLAGLSDDLLVRLVSTFAECSLPGAELGILHLSGALNEKAEDDGAVGNRDARYVLGVKSMWAPDDPAAEAYPTWVRESWAGFRPFSTGRTYINFQTAEEDEERVRASYGANFDRLVALKRDYDPDNLFRSNRNIDPRAVRGRGPYGEAPTATV